MSVGETLHFPCSQCGGGLHYEVGTTALRCPHCGFTEAIATADGEIAEHGFDSWDARKGARGLGVATTVIACRGCGGAVAFDPEVTAKSCAFCGSHQVQAEQAAEDQVRPESLVPFAVRQDDVAARFREWLRRRWFRPSALKHAARVDLVRGVYIPYWTYDAFTVSHWTADAGYYYDELEWVTTQDAQGKSRREQRSVRKVRWEPHSGWHQALFDDVLVPASRSVDPALAERAGDFRTRELVGFEPRFLVGFGAERYRDDMPGCWPRAKAVIEQRLRAACAQQVPGDTQRDLRVRTAYHNKKYKLCLLPLWIASYRYRDRPYAFLCNGQTGTIAGQAPYSWVKIASFVVFLASVVALIAYWYRR